MGGPISIEIENKDYENWIKYMNPMDDIDLETKKVMVQTPLQEAEFEKLSDNVGIADQKLLNIAQRKAELARQRQEIKATNEAYKDMKTLVKDITNTKIDILNAESEGKEVDELKNKLASLISTI